MWPSTAPNRVVFFRGLFNPAKPKPTNTCIWWEVEDKDGQNGDENAGDDDVDDVEQRLSSDHQVEGDVLIEGVCRDCVLTGRAVTDLPLPIF